MKPSSLFLSSHYIKHFISNGLFWLKNHTGTFVTDAKMNSELAQEILHCFDKLDVDKKGKLSQ